MVAAIDQVRSAIPHSGEAGGLIERQFRAHLQDVLPEKVGVSHGFVVDSEGGVSRQMDIILFDRLNTPRIFTSDGAQMFPVEATYACGEIKTTLDAAALADSFAKCDSYKSLIRRAYFETVAPVVTTYSLFGEKHEHWQSIFFCVAANGIDGDGLAAECGKLVGDQALSVSQRIDTIVALKATNDRNVLLNVTGSIRGGIPDDGSIDLLPSASSTLVTYAATEPWSLFVMLLLRYMTQAPMEPVNVLKYGGDVPY